MKIVLAEVPYTKDRNISVEQSCCPEGATLSIAVFDEHSDNNDAFYKEIADADIIINGYVYFGKKEIDADIADRALKRLDVDKQGLDMMDRRYLNCIAQKYAGGPVGADTLAAALSEERDTIEEVIEPYLLQQGYLQRTPRGRVLTALGYKHLGLQPPAGDAADLFANT